MTSLAELASSPRVTVRRPGPPDPGGRAIVYWMQRAQRATANPALDTAIHAANALRLPVVAFFGLTPAYPNANRRHYAFLADGLPGIAKGLTSRGVGFVLRRHPDHDIVRFCRDAGAALVVGDENPLREPEQWRRDADARLRVPFWTVDADVVVPTVLLAKEQYAARTMRPRLRPLIPRFLEPHVEPRARVPWRGDRAAAGLPADEATVEALAVDGSAGRVASFRGGPGPARRALARFVNERLRGYAVGRNHPELDATSQLSPYLHFGHLGPRDVARAVRDADAPREDRDAFLEEFIVRRELAVNFVRFNPRYDSLDGCEPWARRTLEAHAADRREPSYSLARLEAADTHDPLWNAAQVQMVEPGWMHGYVRMYWA
jgi:deoxyribodipyrimidine photo-lyase